MLFEVDEPERGALAANVETSLGSTFGYSASVALRSHDELRTVVDGAPPGFGSEPESYLSDVLFLMPPLTPAEVLERLTLRVGVDEAHAEPTSCSSG